MGLLVYKVANYNTTAEREQYRAVCKQLMNKYSSIDELCVFIANYNIYDCEYDGILIKGDAVVIVEFKNYGGKFSAVENGEWRLEDGTIIKGGSRKTPYQQSKINRAQLRSGLIDGGILKKDQIKDIPVIILFNHSIQCDNKLSGKVRSWLHISDMPHFIEKVEDITSRGIDFSNNDILNLIPKLALDDDFLDQQYSSTDVAIPQEKENRERSIQLQNNNQGEIGAIIDSQMVPLRRMVNEILTALTITKVSSYIYSYKEYGDDLTFEREYVVIIKDIDQQTYVNIKKFLRREDVYYKNGVCYWFEGLQIADIANHKKEIAQVESDGLNKDMIYIPSWLQDVLFDEMNAIYAPDHVRYEQNINICNDEVRTYLGTYFPRSYAESFSIWDSIMSRCDHKKLFAKLEISILSIGAGTGGDVIGLIEVIHKYGLSSTISICAIDGNVEALNVLERLVEQIEKRYMIQIALNCLNITIQNDIELLNIDKQYDFIISSKFGNEIVNTCSHPYYKLLNYAFPKLDKTGLILLVDVTTCINGMFIPIRLNKEVNQFVKENKSCRTLLPISCSHYERQCVFECFTQKQINIQHKCRSNDKSLITYRLLGHYDFVEQLCLFEHNCKYLNTYKSNIGQPCPYTAQNTNTKFNL